MRRTLLIASGASIVGLLALAIVFGSAFAQPIFRMHGLPGLTQHDDVAVCHADDSLASTAANHMLGLVAQALGITDAELLADLDGGQSLGDIAEARGYDDAKLGAALDAVMRDTMEQHVRDGVISREQAGEMLAHMDRMGPAHLTEMLDGDMPCDMLNGQHNGMGADHAPMMGGQTHEGMMGGQYPGHMMGENYGAEGDNLGGSCHVDDGPVGEPL